MKGKGHASSADKAINLVIAVVIIAVLAAGVFAVYKKVSESMFDKAVADGTAPQTVATLARQSGQTVDEFLENYGLADSTLNKDSSTEDFMNSLSVKNFAAYQGEEYDAFIEQYGLTDKVSEDMTWEEAQKLIPLGKMIGIEEGSEDAATQLESIKEQFGLDASVNANTPWGEVEPIITAKQEEMMAQAEAEAAQTEAPAEAEGDAAQTDADALPTAIPAE